MEWFGWNNNTLANVEVEKFLIINRLDEFNEHDTAINKQTQNIAKYFKFLYLRRGGHHSTFPYQPFLSRTPIVCSPSLAPIQPTKLPHHYCANPLRYPEICDFLARHFSYSCQFKNSKTLSAYISTVIRYAHQACLNASSALLVTL